MSIRHFFVALQFLTRLPALRLAGQRPDDLTCSAAYFPLVGALVGVLIAGAVWGGGHVSPWVGALAGVLAWVAITGGLHLDGLGDVADALGASHGSPERFNEVLRDPHTGSFAVIAITLQIAAKLVLLASLPLDLALLGLVLVPAWARWGPLVWSRILQPLKPGLGQIFATGLGTSMITLWGVALTAVSAWGAPVLISALPIAGLITLYWRRRLGGISGDCLGAGIEVMESLLLAALVVASR